MTSVVIPAHNESIAIRRCIAGVIAVDDIDIVAVCNGCLDDTAEQARRAGGEFLHTIETKIASKSHALNMGDAAVAGFPRFYVDADVVLSIAAVREVVEAMRRQPMVLAAAPLIEFDLQDRPWSVRAFYKVWSALPYCRNGMIGSGVYAVSEEGRKRWGKFPDITADDAFVRLHFKPSERRTVETCRFTVSAPRTLRGLIKIKTRAHFGDRELRSRFPELFVNKQDDHSRALLGLMNQPGFWPKIGVYIFVRVASRILGDWRFHFGDHRKWERDDTSRQPRPQAAE